MKKPNIKTEAQLLTEIDQLKAEVEKLKNFKTETQNTKDTSKLKEAEKVAKLNTDRFRDLVDSTDGIVWEADAQTFKFNFVSKKAERLLGFPIKDWYKDGFWASNIYEEDKVKTVNYCASQTNKKLPHDFEYRFVSKNGEIFWLRDIVNVVVKNGAPHKLRGIMVDITKLKHAELSLIESEEKFKEALEITRLGTFVFDDSTNLFETSSICDEIIGIDQSYIRDIQGWINFVHPEDYENAQLLLDKTDLEHVSSEFRIIRPKDKKVIWILGNAKKEFDHKGVRTKITGTIKDISKRKQADIDLRMSELRFREAQSVAHIGSFEGNIYNDELWWSEELFSLFGLNANELKITKDEFNKLIHPDDKDEYISNLMSCLETGNPFKREFRGRHTSGEWRYFETVAGITHDSAGEILGMRGTVQDITDSIIADKFLNDQKERYELAMDATKDGLYDWNLETNETYFSPRWKKMLGYQDDELPNEFSVWEELTRPEDVKKTMKMLDELFNKQRDVFEIEFKMKHKSGRWVDVHSRANAFFDKTGKARRLVGTHIDITERKQAELKLIKAEETAINSKMYLDNIINNIGDPVFVKDDQSRLLLVNDSFCNLLKLTKTEIIGKTLAENVTPQERESFLKIDKQVITDGQENINEEFLTLKGEKSKTISTRKNRFIDGDGNKFLIGTIRDITENKKIEVSLKESEIRFRTIFENSPVLIDAFDKDGKCVLWNRQCEQTFGWTLNELNSHDNSLNLFYPDPEILQEVMLSVTTNPEGNFKEWNPLTKKGKKLTVMWANFTLPDGLTYNIGYDITERKLSELKLNRSNQLLEETQAIAKLGGWELDVASNNLFWTKETYNIHDTTPEEFNPIVDAGVGYFLPDSRRIISKALEAAMTHGEGYDLKLETLTTKGRHIHVRTTCEVTSVEGKPTKLLGVFQDITESVLAEKSLRASADRFERWKSSNFIGILQSNVKGDIIDANDTMLTMLGYSKQELAEGKLDWTKLTPPEFLHLDMAALKEAEQKGYWTPFEKEYYHKDGHRIPILIGGSLFKETQNEYIVFVINLTKNKKADKDLKESEKRFKALHNASFGGIAIHDNGIIKDCNLGLSHITGYSFEELIGMDGLMCIAKNSRMVVNQNILSSYEKAYEVVGLRKNGEEFPLRLEAKMIPYEGKKMRVVEFRDISERKKIDQKLIISEEFNRSVTQSAADAIITTDLNGSVTTWNIAAKRLFGYEYSDIINNNIDIIIPPRYKEGHRNGLQKQKTNQNKKLKNKTHEYYGLRLDGTEFPIEISFSKWEVNNQTFVTSIIRDVSERKKAEEDLQKSYLEVERLKKQLEEENTFLKEEIGLSFNYEDMVYSSTKISNVLTEVEQVSGTDATVLILGETGTGKELIAKAIHNTSNRKDKSLIRVNCAAIPSELIESELFGHVKGSFTGAIKNRIGKFELAHNGTLFLDEIGELPIALQPKLLRAIQEGEIEPVGSSVLRKLDVRIIAATNKDLKKEIENNRFREDLYFRLNVFPITVPALKERIEDIPILTDHFVTKYCKKHRKEIKYISDVTLREMQSYKWPGNVRELENLIERAVIISNQDLLMIREFDNSPQSKTLIKGHNVTLDELQRNHILKTLKETQWKINGKEGAAVLLDIKPSTLRDRMKKFGIKRS